LSRSEALGCIPAKNRHLREERLASGEVTILYPVTPPAWLRKLSGWLGIADAGPRVGKLQLDSLGTSVWARLDGRASIRTIAAALAEAHRLEPREAEVAVAEFIRELGRRGLVGLR
jgi:hypothetical protein